MLITNKFIIIIDTNVLLRNTTLVKFIRNYIRGLRGIFSTSSLVRILLTSFPAFSRLFVQTVSEKWRRGDRFEKFSAADKKINASLRNRTTLTRRRKLHMTKNYSKFLVSEKKGEKLKKFQPPRVKFISLCHRVISSLYPPSNP